MTVGQKPEGGNGGGHTDIWNKCSRKNNYKGPKAWHVGATARRPVWPEHKGKVIDDEVRAAGKGLC